LDLAEFESVEEQNYVYEALKTMPVLEKINKEYKFWVGAHALAFRTNATGKGRHIPEDQWHWLASGKAFPIGYKGWGKGEPDRVLRFYQYESCVALHYKGSLHDYFCKDRRYALCQLLVQ
jgi:hypothetical protein